METKKKLNSIHRDGIRIYIGAFRISPEESLHVEANDLSLELRRNGLQLKILYKLMRDITYTKSLTPWITERIKTMRKSKEHPD